MEEKMQRRAAYYILRRFVQDPAFPTDYSELRGSIRTLLADCAYWEDMCYEKRGRKAAGQSKIQEGSFKRGGLKQASDAPRPKWKPEPASGMSAFMDTYEEQFTAQPDTRSLKAKIKNIEIAAAILKDRVAKLEKRPAWLIPE